MSQEDSIGKLIESANSHLANSEKFAKENNSESAVSEILSAIDDLKIAGSSIINEIPKEDIIRLDGTIAKILRLLAEDSQILPSNFGSIVSAVPNADEIFEGSKDDISEGSLSAEKIVDTVKKVYENSGGINSETDSEDDFSAYKIIKDLLLGNRKISDTVFSENGVYDIFVNSAVPYLVTGAAFISRDDEKLADYEKMIPEILNGPVKHLSKLLLALMTSAFMSALLLLIIKRILAGRSHSVIKNAEFGVNAAALAVSNLPMIIEGVKAAADEILVLKGIVFEK